MNVNLTEGQPASEESIQELEGKIGMQLPADYREFLKTNDGAKPEPNQFDLPPYDSSMLELFIPVAEILAFLDATPMPEGVFPFAKEDSEGIFYLLNANDESVLYWDSSVPDSYPPIVADTFTEFIDSVEPYDEETQEARREEYESEQEQAHWLPNVKVTLFDGEPASEEEIQELEEKMGVPLPADYRKFVETIDGAEVTDNGFTAGPDNVSQIDRFDPVWRVIETIDKLDIPEGTIPIAMDPCGSYVLLDLVKGGVYFWDSEVEEEELYKLADTFTGFLESLEPGDD